MNATEFEGSQQLLDTRPNIIVIFTDDQTYQAIGYQNPKVQTPNIDQLVKNGMIFERAYVASPICAASRASMMTGQFPQKNGVVALNKRAFSKYFENQAGHHQLLPARLKEVGYLTAFYGKSHLGDPKKYGFALGQETHGYDDQKTFEEVTTFIASQKNAKTPFFLWLAPRQPHLPLYPTQEWLNKYPLDSVELPANFLVEPKKLRLNNQGTFEKVRYLNSQYRKNIDNLPAGPPRDKKTMRAFIQAYYAVISHLDHQIGEFTKLLAATGILQNTVVFFLSDNGYHLGSHGLGNKITMHEESVRVPMFAFGVGIPQGVRISSLVSSLDLYPTIIELAGASPPPHIIGGKSLLPLIKDHQSLHHDTVFSECVGVGGNPQEGHRMARNDRYKLILADNDEKFLFDLNNDPFEQNNLINRSEIFEEQQLLSKKLQAWMRENGDRTLTENE